MASATRILVISSFALLREGLCALLRPHPGWHVIDALPSQEAIRERIAGGWPAVAIIDIPQMDPAMQGLIHNLRETAHAPAIIALSRRKDEATLLRILRAGVQACLCQESSPEDLVTARMAVTQGASFLCPAASRALLQAYRRQAGSVQYDNELQPS